MFNNITLKIKASWFLGLLFTLPFTFAQASSLSLEQITKDVSALASDDMKGRANFSPEIEQAANYISQRFNDIGLSQLANNKNFKQSFSVYHIKPKELTASLNGQAVSAENVAIASSLPELVWHAENEQNIQLSYIAANDDMRAKLGQLNQLGGRHLVVVHSSHAEVFKRYQGYFQRGLTKLTLNTDSALVMILSNLASIDTYKINAENIVEKKSLTNVVGILPGKTHPDEIVLFSAHYDHLGNTVTNEHDHKEKSTSTDTIYNGADDDASGTTAVINLAQHFAKQNNNARTLMFTAFSAEEIGGYGSQYFSQQLNPEQVVAMINIEMIGKASKFGAGQVWMTGMNRSNLGALLNEQLSDSDTKVYADPYPEQKLFYRSDNATLARLGVPAHSFSSTQIDKDQHYHQVSDDLNSLDLLSMQQVIKNLAVATSSLVNKKVTPSRVDVSKVNNKGKIY